MKILLRCLLVLSYLCSCVLPVCADDKVIDYEKDARYGEGTPPMVPHRIDERTGEACLSCHRIGLNGAPPSPHPIRLDCTQCHGQGEIKAGLSDSKSGKKSKKKSKDTVKE